MNTPSLVLPPGDFAGYIFDCDGTLAASMHLHFECWRRALAEHHAKVDFTWDFFLSTAGMGMYTVVELINHRFHDRLDPRVVAGRQDQLLGQLQHTLQPVPEVVALARQLAGAGRKIAVASGGARATVHRTLAAIGVGDLFPVVLTVEDAPRGKPAPDIFLEAARRLAVPPRECLVFGDSVLDVQAARAAGMQYVKLEPR